MPKCSICHQVGHNRRTCPQAAASDAAPPAQAPAPAESCPICMETIGERNCATTACGHKFCLECMVTHCQTKNQCPICRGEIAGASDTDWKEKHDQMLNHVRAVEDRARTQHWHIQQCRRQMTEASQAAGAVADLALNVTHTLFTANSIHAVKTQSIERLRMMSLRIEGLLDY